MEWKNRKIPVTNSDVLTRLDLSELIAFRKSQRATTTIAVHRPGAD
jgi:NDP-sugar pyrophosphorylase family protein